MFNFKGLFTKERLTDKGTWIALISFVLGVLMQTGVIDTGLGSEINHVVTAFLELLSFLGIIHAPNTSANQPIDESQK